MKHNLSYPCHPRRSPRVQLVAYGGAFCLCLALSQTGLAVQENPYIRQFSVTEVGQNALIVMDATKHGDPYNGQHTPYRTLLDMSAGHYTLEFIDTVPGFVAWHSGGGGGYFAAGVGAHAYDAMSDALLGGFGFHLLTSGAYPTQQAAFDAMAAKVYEFDVAQDLTALLRIYDHILSDNSGGLSFIVTKVSNPGAVADTGMTASLLFAGVAAVQLYRRRALGKPMVRRT